MSSPQFVPPFPLPPLEAYDGLAIYARTGGLLMFFPTPLALAPNVALKHHGWLRDPVSQGLWIHDAFPGHRLCRSLYPCGFHVLQRFGWRPNRSLALQVGRQLLGGYAQPSDWFALPLRFRLPLRGGVGLTRPWGPARSYPIPECPVFDFVHHGGFSYNIQVNGFFPEEGIDRLWLDAFIGGEYRTREGALRRCLYPPDLYRVAQLARLQVPRLVSHVLQDMVAALDYYTRWYGLEPETDFQPNLARVATVVTRSGDIGFESRLLA